MTNCRSSPAADEMGAITRKHPSERDVWTGPGGKVERVFLSSAHEDVVLTRDT